jgi:hypothetical protein
LAAWNGKCSGVHARLPGSAVIAGGKRASFVSDATNAADDDIVLNHQGAGAVANEDPITIG